MKVNYDDFKKGNMSRERDPFSIQGNPADLQQQMIYARSKKHIQTNSATPL